MAVVMVIDDEPEVRQLIETVISKAGHEVVAAADSTQAWTLLDKNPQAVFVDIDMPGETGVEFVLRLREHPTASDVPVAFVTAYRERARPLVATGGGGVVDVIDKPFRLETITAVLERMLDPGGLKHWVFAYGSNMHLRDLRRWMSEKGYGTEGILDVKAARLRDWRLAWDYFSVVRDGAAANVRHDPGAELRGVVLHVDAYTLEALDVKEGHPQRYHRASVVEAELMYADGAVDAWLYVVRPQFLREPHVAPRQNYLDLMVEAAREHSLGDDYVDELRSVVTLPTAS